MSLLNRKSLNIEQVKGRFGLHSQMFHFLYGKGVGSCHVLVILVLDVV